MQRMRRHENNRCNWAHEKNDYSSRHVKNVKRSYGRYKNNRNQNVNFIKIEYG